MSDRDLIDRIKSGKGLEPLQSKHREIMNEMSGKEQKIDTETVIKFIAQHFGFLCEWDFDGEDCFEYMSENHPEICDACRMQDEDICKRWETYIREKSQEEEK